MNLAIEVQVIRINPDVALPTYATAGAAAVDLQSALSEPITIEPGAKATLIPTGLAIYHGNNYFGEFILPRSGLGHKRGLVLGNLVGTIDSDYQGELFVSAYVHPGYEPYVIQPLERFAQLVVLPITLASFTEVTEFHQVTERGAGGFGSTGSH